MDDGLNMYKITCPIGVICVIFEARPEVNIQISSLALKSGNAVILKGGSEASNSNQILIEIFREGFIILILFLLLLPMMYLFSLSI